jgi:thymidine phosphorylase
MDAELVGIAAMRLGAGRSRAEETVDHSVGIVLRSRPGERIRAGQAVFEVRFNDDGKLAAAQQLLNRAYTVGEDAPTRQPLVLEEIS